MQAMNITITLNGDQLGKAVVVLTPAQLASIHQQETAAPAVTPPVVTPPSTNVPEFALPAEVAGRAAIKTRMAWANGAPRIVANLDDTNCWAIAFTPKDNFVTGRFAGGQWIDQDTPRQFQVIRNRDAAVIVNGPDFGVVSPTFVFMKGIPPPRSGKYQLTPGEAYTFVIWNKVTALGSGRMFMELYFQQ